MKCPYCSNQEDKVVDSRMAEDGEAIRRRRECMACGRRYTTWERADSVAFTVVKRDGTTQPFSREKLGQGIARACEKRDISQERIEEITEDIEETLRSKGEVVTSEAIGILVLARLRDIDDVAYLRFASVYKDFQNADEFEREAGSLLKK